MNLKNIRDYQNSRKKPYCNTLGCSEFESVLQHIINCLIRDKKTIKDPVCIYENEYKDDWDYYHCHAENSHDFYKVCCDKIDGKFYLNKYVLKNLKSHCLSEGDVSFNKWYKTRKQNSEVVFYYDIVVK